MDSYGELCYEVIRLPIRFVSTDQPCSNNCNDNNVNCKVGLDLEPNKYAKLRKQAMLAQEEQNDPMPCALLFVGE